MSRTTSITRSAVLKVMSRMKNGQITLRAIGAAFDISPASAAHHVNKLIATGDAMIIAPSRGGNPALYALTSAPLSDAPNPTIERTPAFRWNAFTKPMVGHEARLRAAADLAMSTRRA